MANSLGWTGAIASIAIATTPILATIALTLVFHRHWTEFTESAAPLVNSVAVALSVASAASGTAYIIHVATGRWTSSRVFALSVLMAIPLLVPIIGTALSARMSIAFFNQTGGLLWIALIHILTATPIAFFVMQRLYKEDTRTTFEYLQTLAGPTWRRHLFGYLPLFAESILVAALVATVFSLEDAIIAWHVGGFDQTLPVWVLDSLRGHVGGEVVVVATGLFLVEIAVILAAAMAYRSLSWDLPNDTRSRNQRL